MKIRSGFVSNSSSASFATRRCAPFVPRKCAPPITPTIKYKVYHGGILCAKCFHREYCNYDDISEDFTSCDEFNLDIEKQGES